MDINFKIDIAKLKALPRPIKIVAAVLAVDILAVVLGFVTLDDEVTEREARVDQLRGQLRQLHKQVGDLDKLVTEYPSLRDQFAAAQAEGAFLPQDRLKLANEAQGLADAHHLPDLHYKMETIPEKPPAKGNFTLASSLVTFESSAYLDSDAMAFWDEILSALPSHYQVIEATLEQGADFSPALMSEIRNGHNPDLVKVNLSFRWQGFQPKSTVPK